MKKIVINNCFGGFGLSPKAIKRIAELQGKECYFFEWVINEDIYKPLSLEEAEEKSLFFSAFSVPNPKEVLPKEQKGEDGTYKDYNEEYEKISLKSSPENRGDPLLIQVVEELGDEANGRCAKLKIIEIPNDVDYEIDEYDGLESIHEVHRSWS